MRRTLQDIHQWVKDELERCLGFWLEHGMDSVHGGVLTCLDREGQVFSTDKSVWMQGRCAWTFSKLCRQYGTRPQWLAAAESCLQFLEDHCVNREKGGRLYFTVTKDGKPLRQRRYNFSEAFYAMGNGEYYGLTGKREHLDRARWAYNLIWDLNHGLVEDPTGLGPKTIPETRRGRALANPMIYLNLTNVLRQVDPEWEEKYNDRAQACVDEIFRYHHKLDLGCTLEMVGPNGEFQREHTAGRMVNPGHVIECSWFLMEEANHQQDQAMHARSREMLLEAIKLGWDKEYGGLLYFLDCLGKPPEAYEHDMKLWWPHNEMVIAALMAYRDTGEEVFLHWLKKTVVYCQTYFSDPEHGEWYGYLRRDGKATQPPCKGSTFKGPFHLPRMLLMADAMLEEIASKKP